MKERKIVKELPYQLDEEYFIYLFIFLKSTLKHDVLVQRRTNGSLKQIKEQNQICIYMGL